MLVNNGSRSSYSFAVTVLNPSEPGNLSFSLNGRELASFALQSGTQRVILPPQELKDGRNNLSMRWDGKPKSISGKPFRTDKNLETYLLLSSPELLEDR